MRTLWRIIVFCFLTLLTQVGGLVYMASLLTHPLTDRWTSGKYVKVAYRCVSFLLLYLTTTFLIVPLIARPLGRVPLPLTETNHLRPLNVLTCVLNRNYVTANLKEATLAVAEQMNDAFPGTTTNYLDANFPFLDDFPLTPHLSHHDGKKLDLAFCYTDAKTGKPSRDCPSFIGYGVCEDPLPGELNTAASCARKGYWQYSLLTKIIPQGRKEDFNFDETRTRKLISLFAQQADVGKIFIEPHLKDRLKLRTTKVRFHGCQAVRHDDHIHIQLK